MYCILRGKDKNFDVFNCIISVGLPNLVRLSPQLCGWKFSGSLRPVRNVAPGIYRQNLGNPARGDTAHNIPVKLVPARSVIFFYKALFLHEFCI